ncbi:hypothetical protein [Magnetospirillum sp. SS-4]|uniref:hypothetical protein n=1 Tax=Magnetospirillum sp. SS-4 TaxID=2681465 RepID=UPI0013825C9F|nr:hypothetical protein [Magnetospirillum sp. SS-4]CAA7622436.1 conserved hypothetical protein [Magnetospirillum sp. SS-4]
MHPLLTFASGLLAGIVGVRLLNKTAAPAAARLEGLGGKARQGLGQAQAGLREATISGLAAIEKSSAGLRARLTPTMVSAVAETEAAPVKAPAKPRRPRKAPAKATKPPATPEGGSES